VAENRLDFISKYFSNYEIRLSEDDLIIFNPYGSENIRVEYVSDDEWTPYVIGYSFHRHHMSNVDDIIGHINGIVNGDVLSVEFFKNGVRCFGGYIETREADGFSYEALARFAARFGFAELKDTADSLKVRGWQEGASFDASFVIDSRGNVIVKKQ
jgi:hypothetical protein